MEDYRVLWFSDALDRALDKHGGTDAERYAVRRERHLAALLFAQVREFFLALERLFAASPRASRSRLLQLGLSEALKLNVGDNEEDGPGLFEMFAFMNALEDFPFEAAYSAGFEVDGSVSIIVGPEFPRLPSAGINGSFEHDATDLRVALTVAQHCTQVVAELTAIRAESGSTASMTIERDVAGVSEVTPDEELCAELARVGHDMFDTWRGGSEEAWVDFAVALFLRRGLIMTATPYSHAHSAAYVLALWALTREFHTLGGDGVPGDWRFEIEKWAARERFSVDQIGLADEEVGGWRPEDEDWSDTTLADVLATIAVSHAGEVRSALIEELGAETLFACLWATRLPDIEYPLNSEEIEEVLDRAGPEERPAYDWIQNGLLL